MPFRAVTAALAGVVALAGCGGGAAGDTRPGRAVARETVVAAEHVEVWSRLVVAGIDGRADLSGDATARAASLLAQLDLLLRAHVVTVAQATAAHLREQEAAFGAATEAVDHIRTRLVSILSDLYDTDLAAGFEDPWRLLTEHTYRYARAVRAGDDRELEEAAREMERIAGEIAERLSDLTGGVLDAPAFEEALLRLVEATNRTIRHQAPEEGPWAEALHAAVETAKGPAALLAAAVAEDRRLQGDPGADAARLRAELSAAMAGTAWFAPLLADRGGEEQARREETRAVLEKQTDALRHALEGLLDAPAAGELATSWHRHHELLADLATAVVRGATAPGDRTAVEDDLASWAADFAAALEEATDGALDAAAMDREARRHVETVVAVLQAGAEEP